MKKKIWLATGLAVVFLSALCCTRFSPQTKAYSSKKNTPTLSRTSTPSPTPKPITPYGQSGAWNVIFADEFNGTGLNLATWEPSWFAGNNISAPVNTADANCYDPKQLSVSSGTLKITAVSTSLSACHTRSGAQAGYASGLINSRTSFTYSYGYMEARVYLPGSSGNIYNWPAFWSDGTGEWPTTGEIDVMEALSTHKPCYHYHYRDTNGIDQAPGGCANIDATGWHIYGTYWEPGKITYYYDGVPVGVITTGVVSSPQFLIVNYALNQSFGIHAGKTMQLDYVRVWKKL
jgi:beta-glucanase (GH16 family)